MENLYQPGKNRDHLMKFMCHAHAKQQQDAEYVQIDGCARTMVKRTHPNSVSIQQHAKCGSRIVKKMPIAVAVWFVQIHCMENRATKKLDSCY